MCLQTWIDGQKYFDRDVDAQRRSENETMRAALIQKILKAGDSGGKTGRKGSKWPRHDIFCGHSDHEEEGR
jgi:N-acetylglucosamine-6-phosphate deacetylase